MSFIFNKTLDHLITVFFIEEGQGGQGLKLIALFYTTRQMRPEECLLSLLA